MARSQLHLCVFEERIGLTGSLQLKSNINEIPQHPLDDNFSSSQAPGLRV